MRFANRSEAGKSLARRLETYKGLTTVLVLGLPRGGVPVAAEVARYLNAPMDVLVVRKLGVPGHEEYAMGAVASGDVRVVEAEVVRQLGIPAAAVDEVISMETEELHRRERLYRGGKPEAACAGKTVIVVDDGLATGSTMRAAVASLRQRGPERIVVAVPVALAEACSELSDEADVVVCLETPEPFSAVGLWYEDFRQTTDDEVRELLGGK